jgi:tripartite-type tricarboxylate transporter receptor subunit TctC
VGWFGWLAPAKTPRDIVSRLHTEIVRVLQLPEIRERLLGLGADPVGDTPPQFAAYIKSEREKWAQVIKQAGIRID